MTFRHAQALMTRALALEAQRVVLVARQHSTALSRVLRLGAGTALTSLDAELDTIFTRLQEAGIEFPCHAVARQYRLSGAGYALMHLALIPHHAPAHLTHLRRALSCQNDALNAQAPRPSLMLAARLIHPNPRAASNPGVLPSPSAVPSSSAIAELSTLPVFLHRLVILDPNAPPAPPDETRLSPSAALLELLGLRANLTAPN